jgi:putative nucleotidyltransferase with HDIG domain
MIRKVLPVNRILETPVRGLMAVAPPAMVRNVAPPAPPDAPANGGRLWATRAFLALNVAAGLAIALGSVWDLRGDLVLLALLIAIDVLAGVIPVGIYGDSKISIGIVPTLAIVIIFGIPGVVIASVPVALSTAIAAGRLDMRSATGPARFIIVNTFGALAYQLTNEFPPTTADFGLVLGGLLATLACFAISAVMIVTFNAVERGQSFSAVWERQRWVAPHYLAMGVLAVGLVASYMALGILGVMVYLTPAVMMRFAIKQYVDKTAENVEKLQEQNEALHSANIEIRRVSDELQVSYDSTLEALVNALDARDQETKGHSIRVQRYMMDIARELGVREDSQEWVDMQRGSLLHDVGKIGVSDSILLKPGKLTPEEWESMRKHPEIGYKMLKQVHFLQGAAEIILAHHERWDGKGYPRGLHQEEINLGARIFTVVDTFDAITSERPYKKAKSTLEAMNEILRCSGSQFDPMVVEAFMDTYDKWVKEMEELHELTRQPSAA